MPLLYFFLDCQTNTFQLWQGKDLEHAYTFLSTTPGIHSLVPNGSNIRSHGLKEP